MKRISIYLAGNVRTDNHEDVFWRDEFKEVLEKELEGVEVIFFDPTHRSDDVSDCLGTFGRDALCVSSCNFVIVDARERQGIGTGAEMVIAKLHGVPVISVVPKETYYRKASVKYYDRIIDDFIHPFVHSLSDTMVETVEEAAHWIKEHLESPKRIKDSSLIENAIKYYKEHQMHKDEPMRNNLDRMAK